MKLHKNSRLGKLTLLASAGMLTLSACTAGFEDINNPKHAASAGQLAVDSYNIGSFITQMQNISFPEQENEYQMNYDLIGNYLGRYLTYTVSGWNGKNFAVFNAPDGWVRYPFRSVTPKVVSAFNDIKRLASVDGANYKEDINYNWALILRAHAMLSLTDKYGPFPMGLDASKPNAYNAQGDIYKALIADLDAAQEFLGRNNPGNLSINDDKIYGGDFTKWRKFANSLKLRMAIRMRFVEPELAKKYALEAINAGVIESNDDNALRAYVPRGLYKTSVEWGDSRMCADIDSYMNGYDDPRLEKYFRSAELETKRPLIGLLAGSNTKNKDQAVRLYSAAEAASDSKGVWMTAAEMWFCRAEGALAGWEGMGGSVKELYEKAVTTSFGQWGVSGAAAYLKSERTPANYEDAAGGHGSDMPAASTIAPKWNEGSSDDVKLERLITQKWIALFPLGQEAWSEIRRTGYPKVFDIKTSKNGYTLLVPNRIPFDSEEKVNNPEGYAGAVKLLGGADDYATPMWWQKK